MAKHKTQYDNIKWHSLGRGLGQCVPPAAPGLAHPVGSRGSLGSVRREPLSGINGCSLDNMVIKAVWPIVFNNVATYECISNGDHGDVVYVVTRDHKDVIDAVTDEV